MKQKIIAAFAGVFLVLWLALPAQAVAREGGTLYRSSCVQPSDPWARSYSTEVTYLAGPGGTSQYWDNGPVFTARYLQGSYNGGDWFARVYYGALSDPGTYAYCRNP